MKAHLQGGDVVEARPRQHAGQRGMHRLDGTGEPAGQVDEMGAVLQQCACPCLCRIALPSGRFAACGMELRVVLEHLQQPGHAEGTTPYVAMQSLQRRRIAKRIANRAGTATDSARSASSLATGTVLASGFSHSTAIPAFRAV